MRKAGRWQEGGRGQRGREILPGTEPFLDPTTYTGFILLSLPTKSLPRLPEQISPLSQVYLLPRTLPPGVSSQG